MNTILEHRSALWTFLAREGVDARRPSARTALGGDALAAALKSIVDLSKAGPSCLELPLCTSPKDLGKYSPEELRQLHGELQQSVQERIRVTVEKGSDVGHAQRQAAEQQLIKSIEKHLEDL